MLDSSKAFSVGAVISRPASQLGIKLGEAHVVRKAGGPAYVLEASQNTAKFDFFLQREAS